MKHFSAYFRAGGAAAPAAAQVPVGLCPPPPARRPRWMLALLLAAATAGLPAAAQVLPAGRTLAADGTPQLIRLSPGTAAPADAPQVLRRELALTPNDELRPLRTETDELGFTHRRYQQYYRGVKVEHGTYSAHSRGGRVESLSGELKRPAGLSVQPTLGEAAARQRALAAVGATRYMWQDATEEAGLRAQTGNAAATYFPTGELVLVGDFRQPAATRPLVLAWKFNVYAQQPVSRANLYVDARTGAVVLRDAIIKHTNATGTFATKYNGNQTGSTDFTGTTYRLRETTRGLGIETYNAKKGNSYTAVDDFTDADNNWTAAEFDNATFDNVALDAHYGAQATFDYWKNTHSRNSYDNAGAKIKSYVHYDDTPGDNKGYENAFWNGSVMTYGDGYTKFKPLVSLDVCAHEIGHAVCERTANLVYQNESGGLNEGFSDIWGACVEYYKDPTKQTWLIGEDIMQAGGALRSMSSPNAYNQPAYYQGLYWRPVTATPTSANDYGGVHTNSGVLNYWFYLLSVGKTGINEGNNAFSVTGININKAAKITYRAESVYLTASSDYKATRAATLLAASDLYGFGSAEMEAVAKAWYAVGLGEPAPTLVSFAQASGPVGSATTITGTNFLTTYSVTFNGVSASFVVNSATSITATVPAGATTGVIAVTTPSGTATSTTSFTLTAGPIITGINPGSAPNGASVVISGSLFAGATAVTFSNGVVVPAASFVLNTSVSPNIITLNVPAGAVSGPVTVTAGSTSAPYAFTVLPFTLLSRTPVRNATTVPVLGPVGLTFGYAPSAATAAGTGLRIFSSQYGGLRNGTGTFSATGNTVSFVPAPGAAFRPGEVLSVTATTAATSAGGGALATGETYQFTTAAGRATGALGTATSVTTGIKPQFIAVGDVNGDGLADMVVANTNGTAGKTVSVRLGDGAGNFSGTTDLTVGNSPRVIQLADVNNDGKLDILVMCSSSSAVYVLVRNATGSAAGDFAPATTVAALVTSSIMAVADFNNDGWQDIAVVNAYSNVARTQIFLNAQSAAGTFVATTSYTDLAGGSCRGLVAADMNNDGKMDVVLTNSPGASNLYPNTVTVALGNGAGGFVSQANGPVGTSPQFLAVNDINKDGKLDFVTANSGSNSLSVRLGDGTGGWTVPATGELTIGASQQPLQVALADMNGDGNLDLVATNYFAIPGRVSIRLGAGDGSFNAPTTPEYDAGSQCYGLAVADLNNDGALDVATANLGSTTGVGGASVLLGTPLVPVIASLTPATGVVGSVFAITGTELSGATAVTFTSGGTATNTTTYTVASSTSLTGVVVPAGLAPGAYSVTVTTAYGTSNGLTFTVTAPDLVVSSALPIAAGFYNNITVTGPTTGGAGVGTLSGNVTVTGTVTVQAGGTLNTNCQVLSGGVGSSFVLATGGTLGICDANGIMASGSTGAIQTASRSFAADAVYLYNGTVAQTTGTGLPATVRELALNNAAGLSLTQPVQLTQRVLLTTGDLTLDGQALTLLSDANGTALVANLNGRVLGATATMQRHIETNPAANGYRHYASPMAPLAGAETLATLATTGYTPDFSGAADYNSSATPGTVTPFPTVFLFNQDRVAGLVSNYGTFDKAWQAALGTEMPQAGRGYAVQAPGAALVDFTGTLISGSVSRANLQRASADPATGWHLLGNPFPSPLDWSTMSVGTSNLDNLQNMDGAVYVFQSSGPYAGSYRTYLASAPGTDSPLIPAGSGFFVHTTSPATPGIVRFNPANRVTTFGVQPAFGRGTADGRARLTLALRGANGLDALTVYADPAATLGLDAAHDALKLANPTGLNLSAQAGANPLAIDALPSFTASTTVPLNVGVPAAGTYTLAVRELMNLPAGTTAVLVDTELNTRTNLATLPAVGYAFSVTAQQATKLLTGRFYLNLGAAALATASGQAAATVQLYPNPAHGAAKLTGARPGTVVTVHDALGRSVTSATADATGTAALTLPAGLAAGVYVVRAGQQALRLTVE